jgi:hypothetical protein
MTLCSVSFVAAGGEAKRNPATLRQRGSENFNTHLEPDRRAAQQQRACKHQIPVAIHAAKLAALPQSVKCAFFNASVRS